MVENKITLSGFAGTGKSTVGKILEEKLGFEFVSIGNFSREFAKRVYGLTINEFQEKCKREPELDKQIDDKFKEYCNSNVNIVVDYRLGFKFVDNAFNVLLRVSDEVASLRIRDAKRKDEDTDAHSIRQRNQAMKERFINLYGVDFTNERNYHLVIDTDLLSPNDVAELIIQTYNSHG